MYIILFLVVIIISSVLSLITSGIEHFFKSGDPSWYMIPLGYEFIFYCIFLYVAYRLKFKNIKVLKFFFLRKLLSWNRMFSKIDNKVYSSKIEVNSLQERSIRTWNSMVLNKSTIMNSSMLTHDRTIQRGTLLIILKSTTSENILTAIDTGSESANIFYEVFIPQVYALEMISQFDKEQEKRMRALESKKRSHIESIMNIS